MAIRYTYSYLSVLSLQSDGRLAGGAIVGPGFGKEVLGYWGQSPTMVVEDSQLLMVSRTEERPRWWMRGDARARRAIYRCGRLPMDPSFRRAMVAPGDHLLLVRDANADPSLVLRRNDQVLFAVGPSGANLESGEGVSLVLQEVTHQRHPGASVPTPGCPYNERGLVEYGPWRLWRLRAEEESTFGVAAIWCAFRVGAGIGEEAAISVATRFFEAAFENESW